MKVSGEDDTRMQHWYLSTACLHGKHDLCRLTCKYCSVLCICAACHHTETEETTETTETAKQPA